MSHDDAELASNMSIIPTGAVSEPLAATRSAFETVLSALNMVRAAHRVPSSAVDACEADFQRFVRSFFGLCEQYTAAASAVPTIVFNNINVTNYIQIAPAAPASVEDRAACNDGERAAAYAIKDEIEEDRAPSDQEEAASNATEAEKAALLEDRLPQRNRLPPARYSPQEQLTFTRAKTRLQSKRLNEDENEQEDSEGTETDDNGHSTSSSSKCSKRSHPLSADDNTANPSKKSQ